MVNGIDSLLSLSDLSLFSSVQLLSHVQLFATGWTTARQASLSITNSRSPPKPMSIESVMPSNHLILCRPLLLLPSIFPSIRVFSNESALLIRWPKYWSFSFNISPSNEHPGLISLPKPNLDLLKSLPANTVTMKIRVFNMWIWVEGQKHLFHSDSHPKWQYTFFSNLLSSLILLA